jgi:predicted DNA-binding transcriptional regulator YafY
MKEFIKTKKVTYNLMSFTAFKALILFTKLVESPKSYREICDIFYNHPYLREQISIDTFRVYMNSLKRLGCEIKRTRGEDKESRYMITSHPFELKYSPEQLQSALKVFKTLVKNIDIEELVHLEEFFEKIGTYIKDENFINEAKKVSMLKDIDISLLKNLIDCCNKKNQIVILYNSPNSGEKQIEIIADKIEVANSKIYLYGVGFEYMEYAGFLVNRIKRIDEIKQVSIENLDLQKIKVVFEVYKKDFELEGSEKLLEKTEDKMVVEAEVSNKFLLKQRLLALGDGCKIIAPEDFKTEFVNLLKDMKAGYYCD